MWINAQKRRFGRLILKLLPTHQPRSMLFESESQIGSPSRCLNLAQMSKCGEYTRRAFTQKVSVDCIASLSGGSPRRRGTDAESVTVCGFRTVFVSGGNKIASFNVNRECNFKTATWRQSSQSATMWETEGKLERWTMLLGVFNSLVLGLLDRVSVWSKHYKAIPVI